MSHNLSLVVCLVRRNEKGRAHGGRKVYAPDPAVDCLRMWCFPQCRTITTAPVYQAPRAPAYHAVLTVLRRRCPVRTLRKGVLWARMP